MGDWKQGGVYCIVHAREDADENQTEDSRYKEKRVESCRDGKLARFGNLSYVENEELQAWGTVMPLEDSEQNGEAGLRQGRWIQF